jgi:hypothetical protein
MAAVEELLLYFLIVPAVAYAGATFWVRRTMRKIAERQLGFLREGVNARFLVFSTVFVTPIMFGLIVFITVLPAQVTPISDPIIRLLGLIYALTATLTVLSEAWIVVRWKAASYKEMFAPVLVLLTLPETAIVWVLTVAILVIGVLHRSASELPLSQVSADRLTLALEIMIAGSFSAPLGAFLSSRRPVLNAQTFLTLLFWEIRANVLAVVCLVLAFLQIPKT